MSLEQTLMIVQRPRVGFLKGYEDNSITKLEEDFLTLRRRNLTGRRMSTGTCCRIRRASRSSSRRPITRHACGRMGLVRVSSIRL